MEFDDETLTPHSFSSGDMVRENTLLEDSDILFVKKITQETMNQDLFKNISNFPLSRKDCLTDKIKEAVTNARNKLKEPESQKIYEMELKKYESLAAQCECYQKKAAEITSILNEIIKKEEEVDKEINELQQSLESCEEPLSQLILRKSECCESYSKTVPQLRKEFDTLRALVPIRFDHTAPENKVRGYILKKKDLTPFDLDADSNSGQFITNFLWHQLENNT